MDPQDSKVGIKIFFDSEGRLYINNCHDKDMKIYLEHRMERWYQWAERRNDASHYGEVKVLDLIKPYTAEFKSGMYRTEYNGKMFIFDKNYMAHLQWAAYIKFDPFHGKYEIETGFPRLDAIVKDIIEDKNGDLTDLSLLSHF